MCQQPDEMRFAEPRRQAMRARNGSNAPPNWEESRVNTWTIPELEDELRCFEEELRRAQLKESSIHTYVDRAGRFIRWLAGDYQPRLPAARANRLGSGSV